MVMPKYNPILLVGRFDLSLIVEKIFNWIHWQWFLLGIYLFDLNG